MNEVWSCHIALLALFLILGSGGARATDPIRITGPELTRLDFSRTDGGLAPAPGLQTFVVVRADKEHPEQSDGRGWTYHHHPDMAVWRGRFYVAWDSCERDEDTWPSHELYSTSTDGQHWTFPAEFFPQGVSTPLRIYFFHAPNGRMLGIAGLRLNHKNTSEKTKGPLVVREIRADHTLGPVFTLRAPRKPVKNQPAPFETANDPGLVEACRQLLANHVFLEQQDYGNLLDPADRMKWNDPKNWTGKERKGASEFGKAMCFFHRADGTLVGIGKFGWTTLSHDEGRTWSQPVQPRTLITGMGKVWGQRTPGGKYILVYDPDRNIRYPLAVVTGQDGITFSDMRAIHGILPAQRYPGRAKDPGASYVRGISPWSTDGSRHDKGVWLVYSVNKEEIWVSHIQPDRELLNSGQQGDGDVRP